MSDEKKKKKKRENIEEVEETRDQEEIEEEDGSEGDRIIFGIEGEEIVITEMTGADERDLRQKNLIRTGEAFNNVMARCTKSIGEDNDITLEKIISLDSLTRKLILLEVRRTTYGDNIDITKVKCDECEREMSGEVEMPEEFQITPPDLGATEVTVKEGIVNLKPLTGREEKQLALMTKPDSLDAIRVRIIDINGEKRNRSHSFIKKMKASSLNQIRNKCKELDGLVDTSIEVFCDKCDAINKLDITDLPSFFYLEMS